MTISKKLEKFLKVNEIKYELVEHRTVYTAFDKASTLKIPQKIVGKTLILKTDRNYGIALIPANRNLDKAKFKKLAKAKSADFATEAWTKKNLKGVRVGAVPPFGNLWKLPTFIDRSLVNQSRIIINSGNWNWSLKINPNIFKKTLLSQIPIIVGHFSKAR